MLEEVKGVFGGLEVDFEAAGGVGLEFLAAGTDVKHGLLFVAGLHVLLLDGPENQHVDRQSIGHQDLPLGRIGHKALKYEV